ncbi:MAG: hypothetical protein ABSA97_09335 [Verrucomicrobiia bacterium]
MNRSEPSGDAVQPISRRAFVRRGALVMVAAAFGGQFRNVLDAAEAAAL